MASSFKKLVKRLAPSPKKLTPEFVKKSETLTKLSNASIAHRSIRQNSSIAKAPNWGDTKAMRANLREQHELQTTPGSKTSSMIRQRDALPADDPERARLTAQINASTLQRGKLGIAVGGTVVGGVAGKAITTGGSLATRENPQPGSGAGQADTLRRYYPSTMELMYSQNPAGAPLSQTRGGVAANGGVLAKVVNVIWQLLVPKRA